MARLNVVQLVCGYGKTDIVKGVSFSLNEGEVLSIAGPNGCGKTTLLRGVCGLIPIRSGNAYLDGQLISSMPLKERAKKIAILSQTGTGGDYSEYTVKETVIMGRYARRKDGLFSEISEEDTAAAEKYIGEVGLHGLENRLITELSGGQLQRVFLARAFAQEPDILFLDEPANHLDLKHCAELAGLLRNWSANGKSVVGVFHDLGFAAAVSDRILLMRDGEAVMCAPACDIMRSDLLNEVFDTDVRGYMQKVASVFF
ncbi:MAG: ABC transporter ATP-binding protein [Oscillospiraceae bacterium]|nr:ABC transporter ATP-binding protein [Oscillospiraceae bacterium]